MRPLTCLCHDLQDGAGNHQASMRRLGEPSGRNISAARSEYDKAALVNCSQEAKDLLERMLEKECRFVSIMLGSSISDCTQDFEHVLGTMLPISCTGCFKTPEHSTVPGSPVGDLLRNRRLPP